MEGLAHQVLPQGIGFEWTELAYQQQQRGTPTLLVFGAAALFVFLVLVAQYESWRLPMAIVLIMPICILASVTGLLLPVMPLDILTQFRSDDCGCALDWPSLRDGRAVLRRSVGHVPSITMTSPRLAARLAPDNVVVKLVNNHRGRR